MVKSLSEREQNVLELSLGLFTRLREEEDLDERCLDEASIDSQFLFRFEVTWCRWVVRIRSMMAAMIGQTGDALLSSEDGARWLLHLDSNAGLSVSMTLGGEEPRYTIENARGYYHILDEDLREASQALAQNIQEQLESPEEHRAKLAHIQERKWLEANQTSKIQLELERLARSYNLVPSNHRLGESPLNQVQQQYSSVVSWVIWGHVPPCFLDERTRLIESQVQAESQCSIRPWKWGNEKPFSMNRMPLRTRTRTWAIYCLSERGGGNLQEKAAVALWNSELPNRAVTLEGFQDDRTKLFDLGSGKALFPSLSECFDSIRNRWAVLVGINEYDDSRYGQLQVCAKDVEAVCDVLVSNGFRRDQVRLLTDSSDQLTTRVRILESIKVVADATEPDDLLLFYFSGHGDVYDGEPYLVSRDASQSVLSDTAVPISRLIQIVEEAPARAKVIVLDACHSGAKIDAKAVRPMSEAFIRRVFEESEGIVVLSSCKQGELSYIWQKLGCSVFTHYLLEALEGRADRDGKGFVTVQDVNRYVVDGVKRWAVQNGRSQNPTFRASIVGDIPLARYQ